MNKYFYPIFKLPTFYERDYVKEELPLWVKWWLLGKAGRELSEILTGSEFTLLNTISRKFKIFELSGRTEQTQLSGKNLLNVDSNLSWTGTKEVMINLEEGQYIISLENWSVDGTNNSSVISIGGSSYDLNNSNKTRTITVSSSITKLYLYSYYNYSSSVGITATIKNLMIRKASVSDASYEPYCGGIPSPSPDFPQQIKNVTGNANVKIQNKNLAWNGWAEDFVSRINSTGKARIENYDNRNCLLFSENAGYPDYDTGYIFKINFKENTRYTFAFDFLNTATINQNIVIIYTDGTSENVLNSTANTWKKAIFTTQNNKTVKYIKTAYYSGTKYIDLDTFMVLEGAYTAETIPDYVPHQEQNLPFTFAEGQRGMQGTQPKDDGIHNARARVDLSTLTWSQYATNKYTTGSLENKIKRPSTSGTKANILAEKYIVVTQNTSFTNGVIAVGVGGNVSCMDITGRPSGILEYELVEEEIIPYNSTQKAQYEAMKQAKTYKDITYITTESEELAPELKIQYWKERGTEE